MLYISRYAVKSECLTPWIKFIWHFEMEDAHICQKLLPTDCIDIILNLSDAMIYKTDSRKIIAPPFHVNGLRSEHSFIYQTGAIQIFGISFYSYGLFPFVSKSLSRIQDEIVDLYSLSSSLAEKLVKAVSTNSSGNHAECIEKALCSELHINNDYLYKSELINRFIKADDDVTIQLFCREHDINIKTFERMVLHYTGYTPKTLSRIKRFQTASNQMIYQNPISLARISYDNNFADQAHFIKEFQKFSGVSPRTFQQEKISVKENMEYKYA